MPYIGNTVQTQGFTPAIDYFSGNGVTVTFTLSRPIVSASQMVVFVDNVPQNPSTAFTVSGASITFTSAPLSGTNNIWVEYTSLITTYNAISQDPSVIGDITASGGFLSTGDFGNTYIDGLIADYVTGAARLTTGPLDDMIFYHGGSFARSPMMDLYYAGGAKIYGGLIFTGALGVGSSPSYGTSGQLLQSHGTGSAPSWVSSPAYSLDFLVIGGGGGGAARWHGGGGAAGGYRTSAGTSGGGSSAEAPATVLSGVSYTVTVGAGGAGGAADANNNGVAGSSSSFSSITSNGGGYGGAYPNPGGAGGSGGGGGGAPSTQPGGSGTSGQGYAGGSGDTAGGGNGNGGGGGGAGAVGGNADGTNGGNGGNGVSSSITGSAVTRAGGGGGGGAYISGTGGTGGTGGGGAGTAPGGAGTTNTGSGGGCGDAGSGSGSAGGAGGSGVVILRYLGSQRGTGGTVTTSGGYTIHTFTSSGTYTA